MAKSRRTTAAASPRVTRHSRDLAIQLKKAEAALKKAQSIIAKLEKALSATAKPRATRHSRDL